MLPLSDLCDSDGQVNNMNARDTSMVVGTASFTTTQKCLVGSLTEQYRCPEFLSSAQSPDPYSCVGVFFRRSLCQVLILQIAIITGNIIFSVQKVSALPVRASAMAICK